MGAEIEPPQRGMEPSLAVMSHALRPAREMCNSQQRADSKSLVLQKLKAFLVENSAHPRAPKGGAGTNQQGQESMLLAISQVIVRHARF